MTPLERIHRYLDGDLDEAERDAFAAWLLEDREHRRLFIRESHLAAALSHQLQQQADMVEPLRSRDAPHAPVLRGARFAPLAPLAPIAWMGLGAAAAAAAFLVFARPPGPPPVAPAAPLAVVVPADSVAVQWRGTAVVTRSGTILAQPPRLHVDDTVAVSEDGDAVLALEDGTRIQLTSRAKATLRSLRGGSAIGGTVVELHDGRLVAEAATQPDEAPLRIRTAHGSA
ncbi:MAG: hypothetical protein H0W72_04655, partial [Planctomycetes bacterium]|nr:hypothetical protein [Planctomycetota bacterium]